MTEKDHSGERRESEGEPPAPPRMQFSLFTLCATITLLCVPFAIWGAMLRANQLAPSPLLLLLCVVAPLALMIVVGVVAQVRSWRGRRSRPDQPRSQGDDS